MRAELATASADAREHQTPQRVHAHTLSAEFREDLGWWLQFCSSWKLTEMQLKAAMFWQRVVLALCMRVISLKGRGTHQMAADCITAQIGKVSKDAVRRVWLISQQNVHVLTPAPS